jgi:hypothetical protein
MTPASEPDELVLRLERLIALIDDLNRLKGGDRKARQVAIDRMHEELEDTKRPAAANAH